MNLTTLKIYRMIGYAVVFISTILLFMVVQMAYIPVNVIEMKQPIQVVDKYDNPITEVKAGELCYYRIEYKKYKQIPATIICQLVNKYIINFPSFDVDMPITIEHKKMNNHNTNEYDRAIGFLKIPETAGGGPHYLNMAAHYRINPLRVQTYNWVSTKFNVIQYEGRFKEEGLFVGAPAVIIRKEK